MKTPLVIINHNPTAFDTENAKAKGLGKGGGHVHSSSNSTVFCLTDISGLEELLELPYITITSYEEIFGYTQQVVIDGIPQWGDPYEVVPPIRSVWFPNWVITGQDESGFDIYEDQGIYKIVQDPSYETRDPITEYIPPVATMTAQYNAAYDRTDPDTLPPLMGIPAGYDFSHLDI